MYLARKPYEPVGLYTVYSYAACSGFASALVPREKASETVRNRGFVNSGFVSSPRKRLRTVRNRGLVRCIHTVNCREKRFCTVFPTGIGPAQ